jgi:lysozyme family protein
MGIDRAFDKAFDRLMGHEGGYTDNPKDPGGETNWGISKRSYPSVDIKNLTREQAGVLYPVTSGSHWVTHTPQSSSRCSTLL